MSARLDINSLQVATPCPARWEDMAGDDRARFCRHCQKHVYNFSTMTATEVEHLVLAKEGNLCGRMYRRKDGTVITADCPTGRAVVKRQRWQWVGGVTAGLLLLVSALWARAMKTDEEAEDGRITMELKARWYDLKVKLGLEQRPVAIAGAIALPVNPSPVGNNLPPSPLSGGAVKGTATP